VRSLTATSNTPVIIIAPNDPLFQRAWAFKSPLFAHFSLYLSLCSYRANPLGVFSSRLVVLLVRQPMNNIDGKSDRGDRRMAGREKK
jgi:hypothetical protein